MKSGSIGQNEWFIMRSYAVKVESRNNYKIEKLTKFFLFCISISLCLLSMRSIVHLKYPYMIV